jgi:hypothetical protein
MLNSNFYSWKRRCPKVEDSTSGQLLFTFGFIVNR